MNGKREQRAQQFKSARLKLGMTQPILARRLGVSVQSIARYESGDANIQEPFMMLVKILLVVKKTQITDDQRAKQIIEIVAPKGLYA